ncbi:MAG: TonB-dependent receptor, partial [Gammaproteobacteria bacterium]
MLRFVFFVAMWAGTVWQALAWQSKVLIRGYVEEADSRERLVGAHVFEVRSSRGTVTDNFGYFSLQVPVEADSVLQLRVSYTGYQSVWKELPEGRDTFLLIRMQAGEQLSEVVVKAAEGGQATTIDRQVMSVGQIARMPAMFGEADVFKALSLLPGVQPGQEGQSAIFVRGGSRDQNLVLLDGVPLYFTNHFAGFFSVFNPDALKQVQLYKGGFPAHYGGRLSSVLDLTMKEGHMSEWHAKGAMGLLSSRLMAEGPIVKDRASMLVAARRSWTDLIVLPLIYELGGYEKWERASFWFGDLNFKVNWMINDRNRLFASGYLGRDQYNFNLREAVGNGDFLTTGSKTRWDNSTFSLRWQSLLS